MRTRPFHTFLAAIAAAGLAVSLAGCGKVPDTRDRLRVVLNYRIEQDFPENIPYVRTQNEPQVEGIVRKLEAKRNVKGVEYRGERVDVVEKQEFGAAGVLVFETVSRRFKEPEPHIDIHVESSVLWELIMTQFTGGRICDGDTGEVIPPRYMFDPGKYHLKAYK